MVAPINETSGHFNADPSFIIYCEEKALEHLSYELKKMLMMMNRALPLKKA
jgi:hypothetical protein